MANYYAQAIKRIASDDLDYKAIAIAFAIKHPKDFVYAANISNPKKAGWKDQCKTMVDGGRKIEAIKLCREETGMGLMEAKDFVEAL